ncbi:MAG: hypothetical protein WA678_06430 [Rhabdochlamydiaceae bacterium]
MTNITRNFGPINKYPEELVTYRKDGKFELNGFGKLTAVKIVSEHFGLEKDEVFKLDGEGQLKLRSCDERAANIAKKHFREYKEEKFLNSIKHPNDSEDEIAAFKKTLKGYSDEKLSNELTEIALLDEKDIENELIAVAKNKLEKTIDATENNLLQYAANKWIKQSRIKYERKEFGDDLDRIGTRVLGVVSSVVTRVVSVPLFAIATLFQGMKTIGKAVLSLPVELFCKLFNTHSNRWGMQAVKIDAIATATLGIKTIGCFNPKKRDSSHQKNEFTGAVKTMFWEFTNMASVNKKGAPINVGSAITKAWDKAFPLVIE